MKNIILVFLLSLFLSCSKNKTVMICGDHVCVNKGEANQYFEENLSLEVKILDKKNEQIDLVQLNLANKDTNNRRVFIEKKSKTNEKVKLLSNKEIRKIKENVKNKKNLKKINKRNKENSAYTQSIDVCKIIEKCNIEEISKYLINEGKKKDFPNISVK